MSVLRLSSRTLGLIAATGLATVAWLAGALAAALLHRGDAWRAQVLHRWARAAVRVLGMRVRVHGALPRGGGLLVANHLSYVDVVLLASVAPVLFVAKSEVARWPLVGPLARSMGTLFVERERKRGLVGLGAELRAKLAAGARVVVFPEGTSTSGAEVRRFLPALLAPAVALGLPVRYGALRYATHSDAPPAERAVCWWGEMTFLDHLVGLLRLDGFDAELTLGAEPLADADRKLLAQRLEHAVRALHARPEVRHA